MLYGELPEIRAANGDTLRGFPFEVLNPPKTCVMRLPTSEEMAERLSKQVSIRHDLGRQKSKAEVVPSTKADLVLFSKIRLDKGEEFNEFEAARAIGKLTYCEVTECERDGAEYKITLKTVFADTVHRMAIPTEEALWYYRRGIVSGTSLPHGKEELRYKHQAAVELYDSAVAGVEGYIQGIGKADVPFHHKFNVAVELVNAIDNLETGFDPKA